MRIMKNRGLSRAESRGFTLIELLIVIFIIGLLASIVLVSVNGARLRGRDARRLADIDTFRKAMELYADTNGFYPPSAAITPTCLTSTGWMTSATADDWITQIGTNPILTPFLDPMPHDPRDGTPHAAGWSYAYCSTGQEYKIEANFMEAANGRDKAISDGGVRNTCPGAATAIPGGTSATTCRYELFSSGGAAFDYNAIMP